MLHISRGNLSLALRMGDRVIGSRSINDTLIPLQAEVRRRRKSLMEHVAVRMISDIKTPTFPRGDHRRSVPMGRRLQCARSSPGPDAPRQNQFVKERRRWTDSPRDRQKTAGILLSARDSSRTAQKRARISTVHYYDHTNAHIAESWTQTRDRSMHIA